MSDDTTVVFTDIKAVLDAADREADNKPAALLAVGGELNGTLFDLDDGIHSIGRSAENTIPLEFQGVSRHHLKLSVIDTNVTLEDLGSRNGTYLNNRKLEGPTLLKKADIIKVGSIALKFIPKGDSERLAYDKLNLQANTDGLTLCYNKSYFNKVADLEVKKSKVTGDPLSLIVFDIDFFKKLNDNFGHDAGDKVLKELAHTIKNGGVRDQDVLARYGGEEFVILLRKTNLKNAFEIAERIRRMIEENKFKYDNKILPVTVSVGVADYRQGVDSGTELFKRADRALYKSKEGGRNQVNFHRA